MTIQHLNDVKAIARTAQRIGANLPQQLSDGLTHLDDLARNAPSAQRPGLIARDLAQHIGNPDAMEKALQKAATQMAAAEAAAKVRTHLAEACGTRLRAMMATEAEEIATAFGDALSGHLATLAAEVPKLPVWFRPERADQLSSTEFTSWTAARDAYDVIESTRQALTPLYAGAIPFAHEASFPITATASLRFANPPGRFDGPQDAYRFRSALLGRVTPAQTLAGSGPVSRDGIFIPSALHYAGATFEWATPAQVTERAETIVAGMVREGLTV